MWLFLLICELVSVAIWGIMCTEDLFSQIIPGNRCDVGDKVFFLLFVAIFAGWFIEIKSVIKDIVAKKCTTEKGRAKVGELCKEAEKKAFPVISDEDIRGDYTKIEDLEILQTLKTQLMAVRTK